MGRPKAWLPFGPECLLQRVVRLAGQVTAAVFVVGQRGQPLPPLPPNVEILADLQPGLGPLAGIAAGLARCEKSWEYAWVLAGDLPLLRPALGLRLLELARGEEILIPLCEDRLQPLLALYRTSLAGKVAELLASGSRQPIDLLEHAAFRMVTPVDFRDVDPQGESFFNINTWEQYEQAVRMAGLGSADSSATATDSPRLYRE